MTRRSHANPPSRNPNPPAPARCREADADRSGDLDPDELSGVLKRYMREGGVTRPLKAVEREVRAAIEAGEATTRGAGSPCRAGRGSLDFEEVVWLLYEQEVIKLKLEP